MLLLAINDTKKKLLLVTIIIASILFTAATLFFPLLVKDIVDEFSMNEISLWMVGGLVLFLVIKSIIEAVNQYIISKFGNMVIRDLQKISTIRLFILKLIFLMITTAENYQVES